MDLVIYSWLPVMVGGGVKQDKCDDFEPACVAEWAMPSGCCLAKSSAEVSIDLHTRCLPI